MTTTEAAGTTGEGAASAASTTENNAAAEAWERQEAAERAEQSGTQATSAETASKEAAAFTEGRAAATGDGKTEKTADKAATEQAAAATTDKNSADANQQSQAQDIWATASPELRAARDALTSEHKAALDKERHRYNSDIGRVSSFQETIKRLEGQLNTLRTGKDGKGDAQPTKATTQAANALFDSQEWKEFEEDYPQLAAKQKAILSPLLGRVDGVERDLKGISQERDEKAILSNYDAVLADHSDYPEIKGSQAFRDWYASRKHLRSVADTVARNKDVVVDPTEVSDLLERFKRETNWKSPAQAGGDQKGQGQGDGQQASGANGQKTEGDGQSQTKARTAPSDKRDLQLESSSSPRTQGAGAPTTGASDDRKSSWDKFERMGL